MLEIDFAISPRMIDFDLESYRNSQSVGNVLEWSDDGTIELASKLLGEPRAFAMEVTNCSPVMSRSDLIRIRDNVNNQYNVLYRMSNVGGSLDGRPIMQQYNNLWNALEGGSYCHYQSDRDVVDQIFETARNANVLLQNIFGQFATNFAYKLAPMRVECRNLQQYANSSTNNVSLIIGSYKAFWGQNFEFHLYNGINGNLDNLLSEYNSLCVSSNQLFDEGTNRVHANFEAEARIFNTIYAKFLQARQEWDQTNGNDGYNNFRALIPSFNASLDIISKFVVLKTPRNEQIFQETNLHVGEVSNIWKSFPTYIKAMASQGFILDPGTSSLKFYSRQKVLNLAAAAGYTFNVEISKGDSLIGTGFSYEHGGKCPPHKEHKDGRDCDIFSVYFKVGGGQYNESKAIRMAAFLLAQGVSRLIYTNPTVVQAANAKVPTNPVAVVGTGHETHMHFDIDHA